MDSFAVPYGEASEASFGNEIIVIWEEETRWQRGVEGTGEYISKSYNATACRRP